MKNKKNIHNLTWDLKESVRREREKANEKWMSLFVYDSNYGIEQKNT